MEIQAKAALIDFDALEAAREIAPTASNISRLAARFGAEAASWAFNQWSLREKARRKFSDPESMLFTSDGLEQASHGAIAAYHAGLFPQGVTVADLCSGIGSDLLALSRRGAAVGFEVDALTAEYAAFNVPSATVRCEDSLSAKWDFEFAFADPSRRPGGKRTLDPASFTPNPMALAERMRGLKIGVMKLSPMLSDDFLAQVSASVRFVSFGWECREALTLFGVEGGTAAVKVESGAVMESGGYVASVDEPGRFIFEADPAAIRAHCLPVLCNSMDAQLLGDSNGYLTSGRNHPSDWVRAFEVLESGAFDPKRVKVAAKNFGGISEIKSRAGVDIEDVRKKLGGGGSGGAILLLYPVGKSIRFAIARRLEAAD